MTGLTWRIGRADRGPAALVLVVTVLASALLVAWPRMLDSVSDQVFAEAVAEATPLTRDVVAVSQRLEFGPAVEGGGTELEGAAAETFGLVDSRLDQVRAETPEPLRSLMGPGLVRVASNELGLSGAPAERNSDITSASVQLAGDPRLTEHTSLVEGAWPEPVAELAPGVVVLGDGTYRIDEDADIDVDALDEYLRQNPEPPATQVAVAASAADRLDWRVGEERETPVGTLRLMGTYEVDDPEDAYWLRSPRSITHNEVDDLNLGIQVAAMAYVAPQTLAELMAVSWGPVSWGASLWFPVTTTGLGYDDVSVLTAQLRSLAATEHDIGADTETPGSERIRVRFASGLLPTLSDVQRQVTALGATIAFCSSAPLASVLLVLFSAGRLIADRRATDLALLRARGASGLQIRALMGLLGLALGALGVGIGAGAAAIVLPGSALPVPALVVAALCPPAILAGLAGRNARGRADARSSRGLRRTVAALVVAVAALAVVLVATRGISTTADPLVVAAPALLALALAVLVAGAAPVLLRALLAPARAGRGAATFLGLAQAARGRRGRMAGLLALVVALGGALACGTVLTSVRASVQAGAWQTVGADLQLSGPVVSEEALDRVADLDGVARAVTVTDLSPATMTVGGSRTQVHVLVADAAALAAVQAHVPGWEVPEDLGVDHGDGLVTVVEDVVVERTEGAQPALFLGAQSSALDVVAAASRMPGLPQTASWVLLDEGAVRELTDAALRPRVLLVDLDDAVREERQRELADQVREIVGGGQIDLRDQLVDERLAGAVVGGLERALAVALVVAVLAGAATVLIAEVGAAGERRRAAAVLRVLGAGGRTLRTAAAWESAAWAGLGLLGGVALGAGASVLAVRAVDLGAFTGAESAAVTVDPALVAGIVGGCVALVAACILVASRQRRTSAAAALRWVEET